MAPTGKIEGAEEETGSAAPTPPKPKPSSDVELVRSLIERDLRNHTIHRYPKFSFGERKTLDERSEEAEARKKEAEADDAEGDVELKKMIAKVIIAILVIQTLLIFVISISQGVGYFPLLPRPSAFSLGEWDFRTLIAGTLIETYFLMRIVVSYLFPNRQSKKDQQ